MFWSVIMEVGAFLFGMELSKAVSGKFDSMKEKREVEQLELEIKKEELKKRKMNQF